MSKLKVSPGILDIAPYVPGRQTAGGGRLIKLSSNETPLGTSLLAIAAYKRLAGELHRYADGDARALRQAIGRRWGLDPARILCGNGSDELISLLASAYAGPGDEVLITEHAFAMYRIAAQAAGATPVAAPERALTADIDAMLERAGPNTRICYLANPNNPTGTYVPPGELSRLRAGLPEHALLVIDAAYAEYLRRNDYADGVELVDGHDNVVMTRTFSKIYGLAALRLGWMYAPAPVIEVPSSARSPSTRRGCRGSRRRSPRSG
jgi:histidinol-phosphate aminotransferase